jgi:superfamily II DNA or RNA helicase
VPPANLSGMRTPLLSGVDLTGLEEAAGRTSYARGVKYARQGAVIAMRWDESECAVLGSVHGSYGEVYDTTAYFRSGRGPALEFAEGECTCPVGMDCKHTVALVLTAAGVTGGRAPTWDQALDAVLDGGTTRGGAIAQSLSAVDITVSGADLVVTPVARRVTLTRLTVPPEGRERFLDEYFPLLRKLAPVTSSDGSFVPPEISPPELVLHAVHGDGHRLELWWEWVYQVGDRRVRTPPDGPVTAHRDLAGESALLAELDGVPLDRFGLRRGRRLRPGRVRGIDAMLFTTEVLPLLARPGVLVETDGVVPDYREVGDSVTIGLSVTESVGENDWFDLDVTIRAEGREVPFLDVFLALARDRSHLLLADGAYFSLEKPDLRALRALIEEARSLQEASDGTLRISRWQAGLWDELARLGVVERQSAVWERQVRGLLSIQSVPEVAVPATLTARLRPYQVDGFQWLAFLWDQRLGGILADDMGLGKTVQALALICHADASAPFLIVAPTSVVGNWAAEAARFAPGLRVATVTKRGQGFPADADVVVTSYTLLRLDVEAYAAVPWAGLVMDEAQYTKNHQSKVYQCLRRVPAEVKLAITGTPMENNLMELWSLLSITAPGLFPSPSRFKEFYAKPIERDGDAELLARLRRRVRPLMKRRTKEQVARDLPPKLEQVLEVDLHPRHRKLYQTVLQRERQKVLGLLEDMDRNRFSILRSLTTLRRLCLHAGLVDDQHADLPSAKVDALSEQLRDVIDGGHRALVFSQFTGFLATVRARLDADGVEYCYLDGRTRNRADVLTRFKEGTAPVFLISLKAGGAGLNLTEADYCFLLDPWWNPAAEAQAVDRTHRIGQHRNVMVYRLIARDTVEQKVLALQRRKAQLFTNVMDDGDVFSPSLTAEDVRGLFE